MMKKYLAIFVFGVLFLTACTEDKATQLEELNYENELFSIDKKDNTTVGGSGGSPSGNDED